MYDPEDDHKYEYVVALVHESSRRICLLIHKAIKYGSNTEPIVVVERT